MANRYVLHRVKQAPDLARLSRIFIKLTGDREKYSPEKIAETCANEMMTSPKWLQPFFLFVPYESAGWIWSDVYRAAEQATHQYYIEGIRDAARNHDFNKIDTLLQEAEDDCRFGDVTDEFLNHARVMKDAVKEIGESASYNQLLQVVFSKDSGARAAIAAIATQQSLKPEVLNMLANDEHLEVRLAVAQNQSTPMGVLKRLSTNRRESPQVRIEACKQMARRCIEKNDKTGYLIAIGQMRLIGIRYFAPDVEKEVRALKREYRQHYKEMRATRKDSILYIEIPKEITEHVAQFANEQGVTFSAYMSHTPDKVVLGIPEHSEHVKALMDFIKQEESKLEGVAKVTGETERLSAANVAALPTRVQAVITEVTLEEPINQAEYINPGAHRVNDYNLEFKGYRVEVDPQDPCKVSIYQYEPALDVAKSDVEGHPFQDFALSSDAKIKEVSSVKMVFSDGTNEKLGDEKVKDINKILDKKGREDI